MSASPPTAGSATPSRAKPPLERAIEHLRNGRAQAAAEVLSQALRADPHDPRLWNAAGSVAKELGRLEEAEERFRRALSVDPQCSEAQYNLGVLLQEQNRMEEAYTAFRAALARPAWHPRALNNLGVLLIKKNEPEEALRCFDQAIGADPGYGKGHHNRGRSLVILGRIDEARRAFEMALKHLPPSGHAHVFRNIAFLKTFTPGDPGLGAMEALAVNIDRLSDGERMELHFALGKAYDDLGEREKSLGHYVAGNREKRRLVDYNEAETLARFERIRAAYPLELFAQRRGVGVESDVPVFVVGMPRSGSTLVEQILSSHPGVHGAGESDDFRKLAEATRLPDGTPPLPEGIARLPDPDLRALGARYLERLRSHAPDARRIVDKGLVNFQLVGLLHLALPSAKFIHTRRDPLDTCLSCFSRVFQGEHSYSYDLGELGRYWRAHDRLMQHWHHVLPPGVLQAIDYERMVDDPEGQTRRLLDHCGLDWDAACLSFHETQRPIYTASAAQVRQPIYRSSVHRSHAYGDLLQPLQAALTGPANE